MKVAASRLVFIDETWIKTNMAPLRGWGPRGRRLKAYAPHGHWKTLTFIAALRCDHIDALFVFDVPINGEAFSPYWRRRMSSIIRWRCRGHLRAPGVEATSFRSAAPAISVPGSSLALLQRDPAAVAA